MGMESEAVEERQDWDNPSPLAEVRNAGRKSRFEGNVESSVEAFSTGDAHRTAEAVGNESQEL